MTVRSMLAGVFLFVIGLICGIVLQTPAKAQNALSEQGQGQWIFEPINKASFADGYMYNRQTGEVFMIERANKTALKAKQ